MGENAHIGGKFLQPPADLRQLRYVVAIAEEGSFTAAAARLQIAQQSLSQQIALVERRLGGALFDRGPRGVTLTVVGAALLPEARAVLAAADRAFDVARRAAAGERCGSASGSCLPSPTICCRRWCGDSREQAPELAIDTEELPIAQLVTRLRDGTLDAGLSRPPLVDDLVTEEIMREPVAAVLPTGHRLAGADSLTLADLADEPWVLTGRATWPPWHRKYDRTSPPRAISHASCSAGPARRTCWRWSPPGSASRGCRCHRAACATAASCSCRCAARRPRSRSSPTRRPRTRRSRCCARCCTGLVPADVLD